jgi:hypothetical protein
MEGRSQDFGLSAERHRKRDRMKTWFAVHAMVLAICLSASHSPCRASETTGESNDQFLIAKAGCDQAWGAITSGKGKVTISSWSRTGDGAEMTNEDKYRFVFSGSRYRLSTESATVVPAATKPLQEASFDGQKITVLDAGARQAGIGGSKEKGLDNYIRTQIMPQVHGRERIGSTVVEAGSPIKSLTWSFVRNEVLNGDNCIVVEVVCPSALPDGQTPTAIRDLWIDPSKGFTIPLIRTWVEGAGLSARTLAREESATFRDAGNGLWVPTQSTLESYRKNSKGEIEKSTRVTVTYDSTFEYNVPISDAELFLIVPSGTTMINDELGALYTVP